MYLQAIGAARHGCEYVVAVHGAEYEARAVPWMCARATAHRRVAAALEAAHAHRRQVLGATLNFHLGASVRVLTRRQEERAVNQRVLVEHQHRRATKHAGDSRPLQGREGRQDEAAGVVVAVVALVLHLQKFRKN